MSPSATDFLRFIRFSHTVFALPFALGSMVFAANGLPPFPTMVWILSAMVLARTAAMTFNRLADWEIDKRNPRTATRHQLATRPAAVLVFTASVACFVVAAAMLNPLCLALAPVALILILGYSLTKRFTHFSQIALGLALAVAPVGAWIAVTGSFATPPLILAGSVLLWVAGFDIIYATQDYEIDQREGLHSMVVWLGIPRALNVAVVFHALAWVGFLAFGITAGAGAIFFGGIAACLLPLVHEHRLARSSSNVEAVNRAFFQSNATVSVIFLLCSLGDRLIH
jgi:4-hydroxybenzoate polyprenyltransferase